jgi:hypothetical protein
MKSCHYCLPPDLFALRLICNNSSVCVAVIFVMKRQNIFFELILAQRSVFGCLYGKIVSFC